MTDKPTPIQQVRKALEASINMDSPMECYPDGCDEGCAYMPDCVSKKILDALQILQNTVLVNEEKLRQRIKSDLCGEYGRLNYRYRGHITEAEIDAEIHKLTKEDGDE